MKRFWLGAGVLVVLLVLGIVVTVTVDRFCTPISQNLTMAIEAVAADQWDRAERLAQAAQQRWKNHRALHAAVTNHEPMEQIDALFRQLEIYARAGDGLRFAQCCAQLASMTEAIAEAQALCWWNLL